MLRRSWQILTVFLLVTWLLPATLVGAEERKDEWKQSSFAFKTVKMLVVKTEFGPDAVVDDMKRLVLNDKVRGQFSVNDRFAKAGLSFLSYPELVKKVGANNNENMAELEKSDPAQFNQLMQDGLAFYAQGLLQVRFNVYNDTIRHIPAYVETYTTTERVCRNKTITGPDGRQTTIDEWVDIPVTKFREVPAHDEVTAHTAIEVTMVDTKTNQPVWKMVDSRDAMGKDKDGMVDRTLKRAAERLEALKNS
nr:hypothetical protein [uncultured Anaeromusa sp.]